MYIIIIICWARLKGFSVEICKDLANLGNVSAKELFLLIVSFVDKLQNILNIMFSKHSLRARLASATCTDVPRVASAAIRFCHNVF